MNDTVSWGSPDRVADGVQALWRLYHDNQDDRILAAIQRLTRHTKTNIRVLAIHEAGRIRDFNPELVWEIAETAALDQEIAVVSAGVQAANYVAHLDFERLRRLMFSIYDQRVAPNFRGDFSRGVLNWMLTRFLADDPEASTRIQSVLLEPWEHYEMAKDIIVGLAGSFIPQVNQNDTQKSGLELVKIVEHLSLTVEHLRESYGAEISQYPEIEKMKAESCYRLLSDVAEQVYFASDVFNRAGTTGTPMNDGTISAEQLGKLFPVLRVLSSFAFSRTAYYVVKTLLGGIEARPREVLLLGIDVIGSGMRGGLLSENLAGDDIRNFLLRYINGHRGLLESDRECLSRTMDIVDRFIDAGWPQWIDIVFRLDRIYRGD